MPGALLPALPSGASPRPSSVLPESIDPEEAYSRLRKYCLALLEDWKDFDLENRFAFCEKRGTRLRRVEAALILISNLPEKAAPADYGVLASSFESGELEFLAGDLDSEGFSLSSYALRMKSAS
jgi:hypothetical protein